MNTLSDLLIRGLRLRCPVCGKGKLYSGIFKMHDNCSVCGYHFEREEGYFTSAIAINIVVSEFIVAAFTIPLAANPAIPMLPVLLIGMPIAVILPLLFYRHSRSLWMSMDLWLNPLRR
jgi:uncharacterized protein (DUF983 family)